jgi:uncharacterized membrane protein YccC
MKRRIEEGEALVGRIKQLAHTEALQQLSENAELAGHHRNLSNRTTQGNKRREGQSRQETREGRTGKE